MEDAFRKSVLPSGITLVTLAIPHRRSVSVGAWCRSGARDEPPERLGITHFIEHMMFKGTEQRDARAIASSLESLGGHLDAFTAREQVCYYARALAEHLPDVVDVIGDIMCRSRFADTEIEREKSVVREEIFSCDDNPDDKVSDVHAEQVWGAHGLGRPILGTVETVDALGADALQDYFRRRYRADQLVISATGHVEHDGTAALVERCFTPPSGDPLPLSDVPPPFEPTTRHDVRDDLQQLYLSLGTRGVPFSDPARYPLIVLNTLLGGGMSSRLFQSVREEAGLAYSVYSAADFHRDAGQLSVHLGVSPDRGREALARVRSELENLVEHGPTADEIQAARSQLRGSVLMSLESVSSRMVQVANEELYLGRHQSPDEQVERVMAVTDDDVRDVASRFLVPGRFALTALGPAGERALDDRDWPRA
jgi:predicted Zn-dependent peptidase